MWPQRDKDLMSTIDESVRKIGQMAFAATERLG
jgi:hypothetical protein